MATAAVAGALAAAPARAASTAPTTTTGARASAMGPAPAGQSLELVLPLAIDDSALRQFALAVSTPGSPRYGEFEPISQLARRFGANGAAAARVAAYLRDHGAADVRVSPTRMYVAARLRVAASERLFATPLERLRAADGREFIAPTLRARAASAPVPRPLRGLVTGVIGLDTEPAAPSAPVATLRRPVRAHASAAQPSSAYLPRTGTASGCRGALGSGAFTPNQYLTAYGFDVLHHAGLTGAHERVALIEIDGFKRSDLTVFGHCFRTHVPPVTTHTIGFTHPLAPGGEATLDLEVLTSAVPAARSLDVYEIRDDASRIVEAFEAPLIAPGARPQVISASLGTCEPFVGLTLGATGVQSVERSLELAAATGTTVLSSAGDDGSSACQLTDGSIVPRVAVSYPASSTFVTAVGGTNLELDAANHIVNEMVWNDTDISASAGGGGFSGLFARPAYQQSVVSANARELPDVSLLADLAPGYAIYCSATKTSACDGWVSIGGTSAAAPLLAGGLALIDQDLRRQHRQLLGLVNPLLYRLGQSTQGASIFRDVTQIGNDLGPFLPAGNGKPLGCCTATAGFDPASGWGSPNLSALASAALSSARPAPDISLTLPAHQHPLAAHALFARVRCSAGCRAYVSGNVVLSKTTGVGVRSRVHRFASTQWVTLRVPLSHKLQQRLRGAERAHHDTFVELFGVAVDGQGQPLAVTSGAALHFSG
jgi:kumamolisin